MKGRSTTILMLALLLVMATMATANSARSAPPPPEAGWVTLMSEDFEGQFPHSPWHIGPTGAPYLWGQRTCNPHGGIYSLWGGGGGSLGSQVPCGAMYTTGYVTTLSYGPLDLSACSDLRLNFAHWTMLGAGDSLGVGFSNDNGASWSVLPIVGNPAATCGGYCQETFYADRYNIPLCGRSQVYLLFRFASNASGVSYGTFLDDVSLEAYVAGATPTATSTTTPTPGVTPTATSTPTETPGAGHRIYLPLIRLTRHSDTRTF